MSERVNVDHYTVAVIYEPGVHTLTQEQAGARLILCLVRTFVDPQDPADVAKVHALQDQLTIAQSRTGQFEVPDWDRASLDEIRNALSALAAANGGLDSARMFGSKDQVDPVQHLLGTAAGWGGNPPRDAYYSGVVPEKNDGQTVYRLTVGSVPVDGFWSISVQLHSDFAGLEPRRSDVSPAHADSRRHLEVPRGATRGSMSPRGHAMCLRR